MVIFSSRLLKKNSNRKSKFVQSMQVSKWIKTIAFICGRFGCNFVCNRFRFMPDIVSKFLRTDIWSRCAVWLKAEQTPFSPTGRRFRFAASHRIWCSSALFLVRDQRMIERLSGWWARFRLVTSSRELHRNFISQMKPKLYSSRPEIYKSLKPFSPSN